MSSSLVGEVAPDGSSGLDRRNECCPWKGGITPRPAGAIEAQAGKGHTAPICAGSRNLCYPRFAGVGRGGPDAPLLDPPTADKRQSV